MESWSTFVLQLETFVPEPASADAFEEPPPPLERAVAFPAPGLLLSFTRHDLTGPAAAGRPLRSMSPGLRLRLRPPPLLTRKGLPATTGLGLREVPGRRFALRTAATKSQRRAGVPSSRK